MTKFNIRTFFFTFFLVFLFLEGLEEYLSITFFNQWFFDDHFLSTICTALLFFVVLIFVFPDLERELQKPLFLTIVYIVFQILQEYLHTLFYLDTIVIFGNIFDDMVQHGLNLLIQVSILYFALAMVVPDIDNMEVNL